MTDETPIAWLALEEGTPIVASDGEQVGKVDAVIADRQKDIFSGITFRPGVLGTSLFVPAEKIDRLSEEAVHLVIAAADTAGLEPYGS
jgi:hypothetical protein